MLLAVVVFCLFYAYKDVILAPKGPNSGGPAVVQPPWLALLFETTAVI